MRKEKPFPMNAYYYVKELRENVLGNALVKDLPQNQQLIPQNLQLIPQNQFALVPCKQKFSYYYNYHVNMFLETLNSTLNPLVLFYHN